MSCAYRSSGNATREAVEAVSKDIMEACAKDGTSKLLIDVRHFRGRLALIDDYEVPTKVFSTLPHLDRLDASAVVDDPDNDERFVFFEDAARRQGFNFRIFRTIAGAMKWLDEQNSRRS
jgi:SpoIIAA-like